MADDLNTPNLVAALSAPLKAMNDLCHTKAGRKAKDRLPRLHGLVRRGSGRSTGVTATWTSLTAGRTRLPLPDSGTWENLAAAPPIVAVSSIPTLNPKP